MAPAVQTLSRMAQDLVEEAIPAGRPDTDPRWQLRRGQDIDRSLVVIDPLGTGTRYETYRAWDRLLFCEVAVKVIRPHRVNDDRAIEGFERETSIVQYHGAYGSFWPVLVATSGVRSASRAGGSQTGRSQRPPPQ